MIVLLRQQNHGAAWKKIKSTQKVKGFSLIELIFVVGILGVLMHFLSPHYLLLIARAQAHQVISIMNNTKQHIAYYYQENGAFPDSKAVASILPTVYYQQVAYLDHIDIYQKQGSTIHFSQNNENIGDDFYLIAHFKGQNISNALKGQAIVMKTNSINQGAFWNCYRSDEIPENAVPHLCRNTLEEMPKVLSGRIRGFS